MSTFFRWLFGVEDEPTAVQLRRLFSPESRLRVRFAEPDLSKFRVKGDAA